MRSLSGAIRAEAAAPAPAPKPQPAESGRWLCDTAEEAVQNAKAAQAKLADMTLEKRGELIAAMRKAGIDNAEYLARLAHEETGYGHVEDKIQKNLLVSRRTPGIEDLQTRCETGDKGMMLIEQAPFRGHRFDHPVHQPHLHRHQQFHQHDRRGQRCGL